MKEALSNFGHDLLVLSDLGWNADKCAEFWWQVDALSLLSDLKQWLVLVVDFDLVSCFEVVNHVASGLVISVVKDVILWVHIPSDSVDLVGSVRTVPGHDDGSFKLSVDVGLVVSYQPIFNEGFTILNGQKLRDVVNN